MRQCSEGIAALSIPEPNERIKPSTSKHASIRRKGESAKSLRRPILPEQCATVDIPQLNAAVGTRAGECAFIRAERERPDHLRVSTPSMTHRQSILFPNPYFSISRSSRPVRSSPAHTNGQNSIKGLGKDTSLYGGVGHGGILHVGPLQKHTSQG